MRRGFAQCRVRQMRRRFAAAPELFGGELRQQALRLTSDVDGDLRTRHRKELSSLVGYICGLYVVKNVGYMW